ncbi:MAG: PAS domain-containing protein, partial [Akkermansia sp.]
MKQNTLDKIVNRLDALGPDELRQIFLRLAADKGLLQDVFDSLHDGLILFDSKGQARMANRAAAAIYGKPLHELLRVPFDELVGHTAAWRELRGSGVAIRKDLQVNYP